MADASKLQFGTWSTLETNFADSLLLLNALWWPLPILFLSQMSKLIFHLVKVSLILVWSRLLLKVWGHKERVKLDLKRQETKLSTRHHFFHVRISHRSSLLLGFGTLAMLGSRLPLLFLPVHRPQISVTVSCTEKQPSALHPNNAHISTFVELPQ